MQYWKTGSAFGQQLLNCLYLDRSVVASENGKWIKSELAIRKLEKALNTQKVSTRKPDSALRPRKPVYF